MARKNLSIHLFIVDPQNDFMGNDDGSPYSIKRSDGKDLVAQLPVQGGVTDMRRLAAMIDRVGGKLDSIHTTLDSHHTMHIAHPGMWKDVNGKPPAPFSLIKADDVKNDIWRARNPAHQKRLYKYLVALEASGTFLHCIWPPHCRIGTWGHAVQEDLESALNRWENQYMGVVNYVTKGSSVWTEHFGGLKAQVEDPTDPSTQLNWDIIKALQEADIVGFAGEALSHCVKTTVEQIADNIGAEHVNKMVLLTDCMSPVPAIPGVVDFPAIGQQFLKDMQARGVRLMKSTEFLA